MKHMTHLQEAMAEKVLDELSRQGMTQTQLADKAFLSPTVVSAVTTGRNTGYLQTWQAMFDVLGIDFNFWSHNER